MCSHAESANSRVDTDIALEQSARAAPRWCRSGAFLDAIKLMNSAMHARDALRQSNANAADANSVAQAELGSVLAVAIKQASEEYHCVQGALSHGYDVSYGETVKRAAVVAQAMRLPPSIIVTARELVNQLENSPR
jgi:hypothetical protein